MITVACVYWKGDFRSRGDVYNPDWVTKLKNMVHRNLPMKHRFVCLTNTDVDCESIPLINDWPGWWSKMELFRPNLFEGRVLYLDIDVFVIRCLLPLLNLKGEFLMGEHGERNPRMKEGKLMTSQARSAIMLWDAGHTDYLYTRFAADPEKYMGLLYGDQDFISTEAYYYDVIPKRYAKKIRDCPQFIPTRDMIIAYAHMGRQFPFKNDEIANRLPWAREIWN